MDSYGLEVPKIYINLGSTSRRNILYLKYGSNSAYRP